MRKGKKAGLVILAAIPLLIVLFLLGKNEYLNPTLILGSLAVVCLITSSTMIIKAHKNDQLMQKKGYSNIAGAAIEIMIFSLVMLVIWKIFESKNAFFQAILIGYPLIKGFDTFLSNKFKRFMEVFVYYRKFEEDKQKELQEKSKRKADAKKRINAKKPS